MEQKKSRKADLERGRAARFLLCLAAVVAVFFAVLEIRIPDFSLDFAEEMLAEDHDLELLDLQKPPKLELYHSEKEPEPAEKLKVVEEAEEQDEKEEVFDAETEVAEPQQPTDEVKQMVAVDENNEEVPPFEVETLPEFPGGPTEFLKWLTNNLKYPAAAQRKKVEGKVVAQFIVDKDGSITELKLVKRLDRYCDQEAMRVLKTMPKWRAGTKNDMPCRTMVCVPIVFKL